jgi:beta-fructofuranosidase
MHATSEDLSFWTKDKLFGYMRATEGYSPNDFRDACTFYDPDAKIYRMAVSTHYHGAPAIGHYTSTNLQTWTAAAQPLVMNAPHFMESADFFKMNGRWYVTYSSISTPRCVYYRYKTGNLDDPNGWSDPQPLDGYSYYAAKTTADKQGNRYLCGWLRTLAGSHDSSGWGGALVVHLLKCDGNGPDLICSVPQGVYTKYTKPVKLIEQERVRTTLSNDTYTLDASTLDRAYVQFNRLRSPARITCTIKRLTNTGIFGFTFAASSDENKANHLRFILEPDNNNKADLAHDSDETGQNNLFNIHRIRDDREYQVTICIEKSVAVMYINDKVAFSCRIYDMENNPWQLFCESGQIEVSNLQLMTY